MATILELFAGTQSISSVFNNNGWNTFTIENDPYFQDITSWAVDVNTITAKDILKKMDEPPTVIWASPPCTAFSIAAISRNWNQENGLLVPKSEKAIEAIKLVKNTLQIINDINPLYYFIENPRGALRKQEFMQHLPRYTVTYCKYETDKEPNERRMKPTDLWTNYSDPQFKPLCKNGNYDCHQEARRGARTGTQGLKNARERSRIPKKLCEHIFNLCHKKDQQ